MATKKYIVKNLGEIDSARLSDEFERAWHQRREAARLKYESTRPPRRVYETVPLEEEHEPPKEPTP